MLPSRGWAAAVAGGVSAAAPSTFIGIPLGTTGEMGQIRSSMPSDGVPGLRRGPCDIAVPLRAKRGAQEVDAAPMTAGADGELAPERDRVVPSIEGLVEEPATSSGPAARPELAHHGVPHGRRSRPVEIQLLHHRRAPAERDSPGPEILRQHGAVPGTHEGTVRAGGGVWLELWREAARIGACLEPGEQRALPLRGQ